MMTTIGGTNPKLTYLNVGDEVWLLHSDGRVLNKGVVEGEINNTVIFKGVKFQKKGINGKHRNVNFYLNFLMTPEDGLLYSEGGKSGPQPKVRPSFRKSSFKKRGRRR